MLTYMEWNGMAIVYCLAVPWPAVDTKRLIFLGAHKLSFFFQLGSRVGTRSTIEFSFAPECEEAEREVDMG